MSKYSAKQAYQNPESPKGYLSRRHYIGLLGRYRLWQERRVFDAIFAGLPRGLSALDCPCGPGRWLPHLAKYCRSIIAMDVSAAMVDHARSAAANLPVQVTVQVGDAEQLPLDDGAVDVVYSFALMKHLSPILQENVLREFARVGKTAVVCSFAILTMRHKWLGARRLPADSHPVTWKQLLTMSDRCGLKVERAVRCSTPVGFEQLVYLNKP